MNILVTGGAGMVGSHCAEYYARQGHRVIVYDNLMRSKIFASQVKSVEYNWKYLHQYPNIEFVRKDIRDRRAVEACFKACPPDVVIHAAAQPGVRFSLDNPYEDFTINGLGTVNILEALRTFNPKGTLIYCSTNKVYGENINAIPISARVRRYDFRNHAGITEQESIDRTGHTPYGVSKLAGELYVQDYAHTYGLKTGVFRMSCIYGTRQFGFEDQGWIAWFAIRFFLGQPITIYGDGKQVRDVLWVEDLIRAYDRFITGPQRHGVFNMGGGRENTLSLLELVDILRGVFDKTVKVKFADWRKFDQKVYISDITKARKVLKWAPQVSPQAGIERLVQWIEQNPALFKK